MPMYLGSNYISDIGVLFDSGSSSGDITLQQKTVSPTTSQQVITADTGYDGLESVTVSAIATTALAAPTISIDSNGLITATEQQTTSGYIAATTKTATNQLNTLGATTYTPTESAQTIASGQYLTGTQTIGAISSTYVGSGIDQRDSTDLTASGATITAPAGYYESAASKSVASGTEGTPTATKGSVSNHSITVAPSVTNTAGYVSGGTHSGTGVTVSASELVSGTVAISSSGTTDVTNYASASVAAGSAATPATTVTANPSISVSSSGLITATASATKNVTPTVSAGYVSSGTAGTITVSGSNTQQLTTLGATTYTPSETAQTISSGQYLTGTQTISAISTTYVGSGITRQTALSTSGATVTAAAGYYASAVSATVSGQSFYSGSSTPSSSLGNNGDIYLQTS